MMKFSFTLRCRRDACTTIAAACLALIAAAPVAFAEGAPETAAVKAPGVNGNGKNGRAESVVELAPAALNLKVGERLVYDIHVSGVPAGRAILDVRQTQPADGEKGTGPEVWVVKLETRSNRAVSLFYEVRDMATTFIDVKGGFTRFFNLDKKEGNVKAREKIFFKYDIGGREAEYNRQRVDGEWRTYTIPLPGKVLDPLSALYFLRSIDLKNLRAGDSFSLPLCTDRRVWNTRVPVIERRAAENIGCLKNRDCLVVEPEAEFKGLFERKGTMRIWLDVATGIPLKMTVEIPIGPAEVVLSEAVASPLPESK